MAAMGPGVLRFQTGAPARRQFGERLRLIVKKGPQANLCYCLLGNKLILGRDDSCDISIEDAKISRKHVELNWNNLSYQAKDLGSQNGFLVNGTKTTESALNPGDQLIVGLTVLEVQGVDSIGKLAGPAAPAKSVAVNTPVDTEAAKLKRNKLIVALGLVLVLAYVFSTPDQKPKTFRERAKLDIAPEEAPKKSKKEDAKAALADVSPNYKQDAKNLDAETFFRSGVRELQNKNFRRALTNFDTALSVEPGHELAKAYKEIARKQFEKEVDSEVRAAIRARKSLRYREARMHYETVLRYLEGDKDNVKFVEAQEALNTLDKVEQGTP